MYRGDQIFISDTLVAFGGIHLKGKRLGMVRMVQESSAVVQAKEGKVYQVQVRKEEEDKKRIIKETNSVCCY